MWEPGMRQVEEQVAGRRVGMGTDGGREGENKGQVWGTKCNEGKEPR